MSINFNRYKTYDTSDGFGNTKQWRNTFNKRMFNADELKEFTKDWKKETPYAILGIEPHASRKEIKTAYRSKAMEWHPDRNSHREEEATEMFKKIQAAYESLS